MPYRTHFCRVRFFFPKYWKLGASVRIILISCNCNNQEHVPTDKCDYRFTAHILQWSYHLYPPSVILIYAHTNVTREYNSDNNVSRRENALFSRFPRRLKYSSIRPTKHLHIERRGKRAWRKYSRTEKKGKGVKNKKEGKKCIEYCATRIAPLGTF